MKILKATCAGGVVYAGAGIVPNCPILGEGGASEGYLVIAEGDLVYLPKTAPDTKTTLDLFAACIDALVSGILDANAGGAIVSGSFKADLANIKTQVEALKGALK